ncbi:MAG: outer membrane lipoprotein carrier protein LolA [Bacteroidales bacterium]
MKKMLKRLILIAIAGIALQLSAQDTAEELLKKVIDQTKAYPAMKVDFDYRMVNQEAGIDEMKSGEVFIQGDAYKLVMAGQTVISNGSTIWTVLGDSEEVMVSDAQEGEENITPSRLLTSYYDDHKISYYQAGRRSQNPEIRTIELKPESGKKFSRIHIDIEEEGLRIKQFTIFDSGGNEFMYVIKKLDEKFLPEDGFFEYDESDYPDFEVIDMR